MSEKSINKLNPLKYFNVGATRKKKFRKAPAKKLPKIYPVNELAAKLHPLKQEAVIDSIIEHNKDVKTFVLRSESLAYFTSGSYVTVFVEIDGKKMQRAYSLCSSPKQSLDGCYAITVKRVAQGKVSNYILDNWKVGDKVALSAPEGNFKYNSLRDAKTVICLAGGSGITPFLSMAEAIADGDEDFNMILLFGSRTFEDVLFKKEFEEIEKKTNKVKVVHVLSESSHEGCEEGLINADLIRKYAPMSEPYSIFVSGPQKMMDYLEKEISKLNLERKYVRYELYGEIHDASSMEDHPSIAPKEVTIKVHIMDEVYEAKGSTSDTILQILEKNGIALPNRCRSGECGWCHSYVVSGEYYAPKKLEYRRKASVKFNFIHPCCTFPLSDMEIEVPSLK